MAPKPLYLGSTWLVQKALYNHIDDASFDFQLPALSKAGWDTICNDSAERERLEFTGDAFMSAAVGQHLYQAMPEGTPHQYTVARSALTSNQTFARIMNRMGHSDPQLAIKSSGDAFESIIGMKEKEDKAALDNWFQVYYLQLVIFTADVCRSLPSKGKSPKSETLLTSIRHRAIGSSSPARKRARPVTFMPVRHKKSKTRHLLASLSKRKRATTIDLTIDSDWEDQDDDDIVQIPKDEFAGSKAAGSPFSKPDSVDSQSASSSTLGGSSNPIAVD